ncbi:hypothetical protein HPCPY3281_1548 [Helicobacter pylori CPY3281]|nr:hypothetical protein HPCPY3281_1548 [Helicobacter pylori CPY3281]
MGFWCLLFLNSQKSFCQKLYSLYDQLVSKFNQNKVKLEQL